MREVKDSGIEWIDKIPLDWTVKPLKWMVKFGKGLPITKENLIEQGVPVVSYGQIHSKTNNGTHLQDDLIRFVSETYLESNPLSLGKKGDIFFADTSEDYAGIGNAVLVDINTPVFAGYHTVIVRPDDQAYSRYLAYLFLTDAWRSQLCSRASGIKVFSITQGLLKKATVILPPVEKVAAMTEYLDRKCSQIDAIIARQQEVIEKLKAYKLSVITEAVTKGLNPDVPMKDSGVEWIGKIPKHWKIGKLCFFTVRIGDGLHGTPEFDDKGEYYFINGNNLGDTYITIKENTKTVGLSEYNKHFIALNENTLLISLNGTIGSVSQYHGEQIILGKSAGYIILDSRRDLTLDYLRFYLQSKSVKTLFELSFAGTTINNLSLETLRNLPVCIMTSEEQLQISKVLDQKCLEIESTIQKKQMLIEHLAGYKKSLIYEVVNGKKEV